MYQVEIIIIFVNNIQFNCNGSFDIHSVYSNIDSYSMNMAVEYSFVFVFILCGLYV